METMKKIMEVEKQLLMINESDKKFELSMNDLYKLKAYIKKIGELTNLFFESQVEYANLIKDDDHYEDLLRAYHKKLSESEVEIDLKDAKELIEKINS